MASSANGLTIRFSIKKRTFVKKEKNAFMKFIKNNEIFVIIISLVFLIGFAFIKMIPPGHVGVVVNLLGEGKGVQGKELTVGVHWIAPWKGVYSFPIFEQNTTWEGEREGFNFQTSEGMAVSADIGITYHVRSDCVHSIFQRYRRGMDEITNVFIRNYIRDAINKSASNTKIEDLYSGKQGFFEDVEAHVKSDLSKIGIEISRIYLIGRFHFPQTVIAALNAKIEAMQRAQQRENELREAEAEAKKQIAKAEGQAKCMLLQAEAESKSNIILSKSITPALINWKSIEKWDGKVPQVTSGAIPMVHVK